MSNSFGSSRHRNLWVPRPVVETLCECALTPSILGSLSANANFLNKKEPKLQERHVQCLYSLLVQWWFKSPMVFVSGTFLINSIHHNVSIQSASVWMEGGREDSMLPSQCFSPIDIPLPSQLEATNNDFLTLILASLCHHVDNLWTKWLSGWW